MMKSASPVGRARRSRARYDPRRMNPPGQGRDGPRETTTKRRSALARQLTAARLAAKLTQRELADRFGADLSTIQRWELGESAPRGIYARAVRKFIAGR